jgi:hypothetical protein
MRDWKNRGTIFILEILILISCNTMVRRWSGKCKWVSIFDHVDIEQCMDSYEQAGR